MKIQLTRDKVTKNTNRYAEVSNDCSQESVTPTVYIKTKALLAQFEEIPENITIEITKA